MWIIGGENLCNSMINSNLDSIFYTDIKNYKCDIFSEISRDNFSAIFKSKVNKELIMLNIHIIFFKKKII